ncbi:Prephenate dehydrogenase [Wallemia mellicola]|uniref:Prephenate dehydrogenase [NADP(+)] n=2 Tax=Wallemia mellicola TaxID=1708541 RepID=A0A4T0U0S9_9BASI|nr:Prephenate dehydrogenase [Wallemia mellicola CBS 633.66]TIB69248.1 hypothetical protein E3Q24_03416 [Wallemia mellicola]EIM24022.1 Prephenate dehydrogenase [Wallemia mellicola CBS 633.66]TIB79442.1 hypothetical protein E3Q23_00247 [Wallemia mellicola]TIB80158.1 Prephenate dehydrogenase [Wallemia mellicola]TIB88342.1 Prephenate dehydrogenase [Wallemia mellicola]|eukprot:XP_006955855.1 Prephenate dehydrogenase [Wallemia mellicola CBS 633.66]
MTKISEDDFYIGIIGMGDMGKMYARNFSKAGWKCVVCDREENYNTLLEEFKDTSVEVVKNGHLVSRKADFIIYSVEAAFIDKVVAEYGSSTKVGATVSGQTSVKAPERAAFEKHLPKDVHVVSVHSLHGPTVSPEGQPLVLIQHNSPDWVMRKTEQVFDCFRSRYVYLTYEEHDIVTANTQAVTHAAFLSMGTAWNMSQSYPWELDRYVNGIEVVKCNIALRIYANKWHVYAGLAILNPSAHAQVRQFATSATDLFKLMVVGDYESLKQRALEARRAVFGYKDGVEPGANGEKCERTPILLSDTLLDRFSLHQPSSQHCSARNSHLTILTMVDCWHKLGIHPFDHLDVAGTPLFRMWIGVAEYLFRSPERLNLALESAAYDTSHRADDTEFVVATRGWSEVIEHGSFTHYKEKFESTAKFLEPRFEEANRMNKEMLKVIMESGAPKSMKTPPKKLSSLPLVK